MIIWSGLGILIPVIVVIGMVVGGAVSAAAGMPHFAVGIGLLAAALANWGLWKMIYPKKPKVLIDPETGGQVVVKPKHGLFFIPAKAWTWLMGILAVPALVMGGVDGRSEAEAAGKPGYKELKAADELIDTSRNGVTHGNTPSAREAAAGFSTGMKQMTGALFTGGSKTNLMTDGDFLTYCHEGTEAVVFLCHVPSLRSYKSEESKGALDSIAWAVASRAASGMKGADEGKLMVGLRGISSYGSILSGDLGADEPTKAEAPADRSVFQAAFGQVAPE
jgi:hypothetical protein